MSSRKQDPESLRRQIETWLNMAPKERKRFRVSLDLFDEELSRILKVVEESKETNIAEILRMSFKRYFDLSFEKKVNKKIFKTEHSFRVNIKSSESELRKLFKRLNFTDSEIKAYIKKFNPDSRDSIIIRKSTNKNNNFSVYTVPLKTALDSVESFAFVWDGTRGESGFYSDGVLYALKRDYNVIVVGDYSRLSRNLQNFLKMREIALKKRLSLDIERKGNTTIFGDRFTQSVISILFAEKELSRKHNVKKNNDWIDILKFLNGELESLQDNTFKKYQLLTLTNSVNSFDELKIRLAEYFKLKADNDKELIDYCNKILNSQ